MWYGKLIVSVGLYVLLLGLMERLVTGALTMGIVYCVEEICCFIPITTQSVIEVGGVSGEGSLRNLVPCLVFVSE